MSDYKTLKVWGKSHRFALKIYKLIQDFPEEEKYGISSQLRRASTSVPANIVEGSSRMTNKDFKRFIFNALSSASEVEYFLLFSRDIGIITDGIYFELSKELKEIMKMLNGLIKALSSE